MYLLGQEEKMQEKELYIKIEQNNEILNKKVYLSDIAKMYSTDSKMVHDLNKTEFMTIQAKENTKYIVSVMKVIELISKKYPGCKINNLGEQDFIISYILPEKKGKGWEYAKAVFVAVIILLGSAFSIMTFNADVSVADIFVKTYKLVLGNEATSNGVLEIAYCIGLPIGIITFFNHFSRKATYNDPTPLQVEMRTYEEDTNKALIQNASREGKTIDAN